MTHSEASFLCHSFWIFPDFHQREKKKDEKLKLYPKPSSWITCPKAQVTEHPQELQNTNGCRQNTHSTNETGRICGAQSQSADQTGVPGQTVCESTGAVAKPGGAGADWPP